MYHGVGPSGHDEVQSAPLRSKDVSISFFYFIVMYSRIHSAMGIERIVRPSKRPFNICTTISNKLCNLFLKVIVPGSIYALRIYDAMVFINMQNRPK